MRFHIFDFYNRQVDYDRSDENGNPLEVPAPSHKLCINLNEIAYMEQIGMWTNNQEPRPGANINRRNNNQNNTFVITPDIFKIVMKKGNGQFVVVGDFNEFTQTLTQFQNQWEEI